MTEYLVPTAFGKTEFTEKKSTFIGQVWRVESEEEAKTHILKTKSAYHDARHNCWCYKIREGNILRYSDDGEPQGTAGQPMLEVFHREGIEDICCVVTRYFGGVLLGTGGLLRAYTKGAKEALGAAGISVMRRWMVMGLRCPYHLFERLKVELVHLEGRIDEVEYAEDIRLHILLPEEQVDSFLDIWTELSLGGAPTEMIGVKFLAAPKILPNK